MAEAANKANAFLNTFRSMQHIAGILDTAAKAESVTAERELMIGRLAKVACEYEEAIAKAKADAMAVRESAEAYAKDIKHDADREFSKAKEAADKLLRDTEAAISNALAVSSVNLEKREAELAALTEMTNAKASEIAALDARITAARDAMRKLLG